MRSPNSPSGPNCQSLHVTGGRHVSSGTVQPYLLSALPHMRKGDLQMKEDGCETLSSNPDTRNSKRGEETKRLQC